MLSSQIRIKNQLIPTQHTSAVSLSRTPSKVDSLQFKIRKQYAQLLRKPSLSHIRTEEAKQSLERISHICNKVASQHQQLQKRTVLKKRKIEEIKAKSQAIEGTLESQQALANNLTKIRERVFLMADQSTFENSVLQHKLSLLKEDYLIYQARNNNQTLLNKIYQKESIQLQIDLKNSQAEINRLQEEGLALLDGEELHELYHMTEMLAKQNAENLKAGESRLRGQSQEFKLDDSNTLTIKKIWLASKFCQQVLRSKINSIVLQNHFIHNALSLIKLNTNISDPEVIIRKYINFETNYSKLLESVSEAQRKLSLLAQRRHELQLTYKLKLSEALIKESQPSSPSQHQKKGFNNLTIIAQKLVRMQEFLKVSRLRLDTALETRSAAESCTPEENLAAICVALRENLL